jgi:hypothetical protein
MKIKVLLMMSVALLLSQVNLAQTNIISSAADLMNFLNSDLDYIEAKNDRYRTVEGSPYLDDEFLPGSLSFSNTKYTGIPLRYNIYEGYFEFQTDQGVKFFDPRVTRIDTVWLEGDTFLYVYFQDGKARKQTFMKAVRLGPTSVYLRNAVILTQPEESTGYTAAKPASFQKLSESIYVQVEGTPAMEFKGKKSLEEVFPAHYKELNKYIKSEKLKLKKAEDVARLCEYHDGLR